MPYYHVLRVFFNPGTNYNGKNLKTCNTKNDEGIPSISSQNMSTHRQSSLEEAQKKEVCNLAIFVHRHILFLHIYNIKGIDLLIYTNKYSYFRHC